MKAERKLLRKVEGARRDFIRLPPTTLKDCIYLISGRVRGRMFLSIMRDSFFLLTAKGLFFCDCSMHRHQGGFSLVTPLFAQLLQTAAKRITVWEPGPPGQSTKKGNRICKRCANKGGGELGGG